MRTKIEHCQLGFNHATPGRSVIRSANGGGPNFWLPRDATKPLRAVLKAKAPSPARHIVESSCRLHRVSAGEGPKRGVGSEELVCADMERPELAQAARECSYVLSSGFHQRADTSDDTSTAAAMSDAYSGGSSRFQSAHSLKAGRARRFQATNAPFPNSGRLPEKFSRVSREGVQ